MTKSAYMLWPFLCHHQGSIQPKKKYNNGYLCHIFIKMVKNIKMHSVMCNVIVVV